MTKKTITICMLLIMAIAFSGCPGGKGKKKGGGSGSPSGGNSSPSGGSGDKGSGGQGSEGAPSGGVPEDSENHAPGTPGVDADGNPLGEDGNPIDESLPRPTDNGPREDKRPDVEKLCEPRKGDLTDDEFKANMGAMFYVSKLATLPPTDPKFGELRAEFLGVLKQSSPAPNGPEALKCALHFSLSKGRNANLESIKAIVQNLIIDGNVDASLMMDLKIGEEFLLDFAVNRGELNFLNAVLTALESQAGNNPEKWKAIGKLLNQNSGEENAHTLLMNAIVADANIEKRSNKPVQLELNPREPVPQPSFLTLREAMVDRIARTGRLLRGFVPSGDDGDIFAVKIGDITPLKLAQSHYTVFANTREAQNPEVSTRRRIMELLIDRIPTETVASVLDETALHQVITTHGEDEGNLGVGTNGADHAAAGAKIFAAMNKRRKEANLPMVDPIANPTPNPKPDDPNPRAVRESWAVYKELKKLDGALPNPKPKFPADGKTPVQFKAELETIAGELLKSIENLRSARDADPEAKALAEFKKLTSAKPAERATALTAFMGVAAATSTGPLHDYHVFLKDLLPKIKEIKVAPVITGTSLSFSLPSLPSDIAASVTGNDYARNFWEAYRHKALIEAINKQENGPTRFKTIYDSSTEELKTLGLENVDFSLPEKVVNIQLDNPKFKLAAEKNTTLEILEESHQLFTQASTGIIAKYTQIFDDITFKNINSIARDLKTAATDLRGHGGDLQKFKEINAALTSRRDDVKQIALGLQRTQSVPLVTSTTIKNADNKNEDVLRVDGAEIKLTNFSALIALIKPTPTTPDPRPDDPPEFQ